MTEIVVPVRAKFGYIEVEKKDKNGRPYKGRNHVVPSHGMHTPKELEVEMRRLADEVGASHDQIRIETYDKGKAPVEANPRHRGVGPRFVRSRKVTEVKQASKEVFHRSKFFGGIPQSPEEWTLFVAEFEARKVQG